MSELMDELDDPFLGIEVEGESSDVVHMVRWFLSKHEDPEEFLSFNAGAYRCLPVEPLDVLTEKFEDEIDEDEIGRAAELIEQCPLTQEWCPKVDHDDDEEEDDEDA